VALPSSPNSLSLNQIAGEFGGTVPHSLSEYYAGGGLTPSGISGDSGAIPTSGEISIGQFYGSANRVTINLTISSNTTNYQISASRGGTYSSGITDVILTNNAQVGSNSVGTAAIWTGPAGSWSAGDTITIVNNGAIRGRGGNGGAGMQSSGAGVQPGQAAGDSIELNYPVTVQNTAPGDLWAGGGGGGGGARGSTVIAGQPANPPSGPAKSPSPGQPGNPPSTQFFGGGGGGGGAGSQVGAGGSGANGQGQPGQAGSLTAGGAGGNSTGQTNPNGGNGGGRGAAGQQGTGASDGAGGAAGKAVEPNGNQLTLNNSGQVLGATS
jgi:hypothetical protein